MPLLDGKHEAPPRRCARACGLVSDYPAGIQPDGTASSFIQRPQCASEQVGYLGEVRFGKRVREREGHLRTEAPIRLKFAREHPDQDSNGNIVAVSEAWQLAECVATDDPRLKGN